MEAVNCDFYYKYVGDKKTSFYGIKILSKEQRIIDTILDQMNLSEGIFIQKEEFEKNVKDVVELGIIDAQDQVTVVGMIYTEKFNIRREPHE